MNVSLFTSYLGLQWGIAYIKVLQNGLWYRWSDNHGSQRFLSVLVTTCYSPVLVVGYNALSLSTAGEAYCCYHVDCSTTLLQFNDQVAKSNKQQTNKQLHFRHYECCGDFVICDSATAELANISRHNRQCPKHYNDIMFSIHITWRRGFWLVLNIHSFIHISMHSLLHSFIWSRVCFVDSRWRAAIAVRPLTDAIRE